MRFLRILFVLTILSVAGVIAVRVSAQDAQSKGAALLADARKAVGGEEKLAAVKALQSNGSFRRTAGNNTIDGDVEVQIELPDKYRRSESMGIAGGPTIERTEALNGTDSWEDTSGSGPGGGFGGFRGAGGGGGRGGFGRRGGFNGPGGAGRAGQAGDPGTGATGGRQVDPERVREAQRRMRQADLSRLTLGLLLTTYAPVTWVGTAESPEGNADVLEVTRTNGDVTRLFLDVSTHMPLMMTWQGPPVRAAQGRRGGRGAGDAAGGQADQGGTDTGAQGSAAATTLAMHFSNYKTVDGIKLPFTITRSLNDRPLEELAVKSYKVNPSFKSDTFIKPKP